MLSPCFFYMKCDFIFFKKNIISYDKSNLSLCIDRSRKRQRIIGYFTQLLIVQKFPNGLKSPLIPSIRNIPFYTRNPRFRLIVLIHLTAMGQDRKLSGWFQKNIVGKIIQIRTCIEFPLCVLKGSIPIPSPSTFYFEIWVALLMPESAVMQSISAQLHSIRHTKVRSNSDVVAPFRGRIERISQ